MPKNRKTVKDWTVDPKTGRSNSSPLFNELCEEVARMIRADALQLLAGNCSSTGRLIMAQLAHIHGLAPLPRKRRRPK